MQLRRWQALLAIAVGDLVAEHSTSPKSEYSLCPKITLAVAGGVLGSQAFRGGAAIYIPVSSCAS